MKPQLQSKAEAQKKVKPRNAQKKMRQLEKDIRKHQRLYYIEHQPQISDAKFDSLLTELLELEQQYPEIASLNSPTQLVGSDLSNEFSKYKHTISVASLSNAYSIEETLAWAQKIFIGSEVEDLPLGKRLFQVQWKIDGATLVLYYEQGQLRRAVTRGNGSIGDDVTTNALTIRSIPHALQEPWTLVARGEVYMQYQDFITYNKRFAMAYANPRNLAAGSLKHKKSKEVASRPLRWTAFDCVMGSRADEQSTRNKQETVFSRDQELIDILRHVGLPVNTESVCVPFTRLRQTIEEFNKKKENVSFPVDGLVIKLDDLNLRNRLGHTSHAPRWAVAYKFKPELAETVVEAIEVFVGRTGRVTPRATLQPVQISGTTVRHATLHNADFIAKLDVRVGARVVISKRGEIIPAIEEVVERGNAPPYAFPKICPACKSILSRSENAVDWMCLYPLCPEKSLNRIIFFAGRKQMDIVGLGANICQTLYDKNFIRSIPDIYELYKYKKDLEKLEGLGLRSVEILLASIEASKNKPFSTVLISLGLCEIGPNVCEILFQAGYDSYDKLLQLTKKTPSQSLIQDAKQETKQLLAFTGAQKPIDDRPTKAAKQSVGDNANNKEDKQKPKDLCPALSELHGIGPRTTMAIIEQFNDPNVQTLFAQLRKAGLNLAEAKDESQPKGVKLDPIFEGQTWCITGSFANFKPRELAAVELKKRGAKIASTVSSRTTHLLAGQEAGSKLSKAESLQVRIVNEEQFLQLLRDK